MSLMLEGLRMEIADGDLVIHPGRCRDVDDQRDIWIPKGETRRVRTSRIGMGGLDTGSVKPDTRYAVYLVRQGNDTEGMISNAFDVDSADPPAFPNDGSLAYRRIGAVTTDSTGQLRSVSQPGEV